LDKQDFGFNMAFWRKLAKQGSWESNSSRRELPSRREGCESSKLTKGQMCCCAEKVIAILMSAWEVLFCCR